MRSILLCVAMLSCLGCASLQGNDYAAYDTQEALNRKSYLVSDLADRKLLRPSAQLYADLVPDPVERGVFNIFRNLRGIASSANGFLQGKPRSGGIDLARLVINSTLGIGGIFDVASGMGLADQREDFGQTLAVWGWRKTRYVFVPMLGPTTVRDFPSMLIRSYLPRGILGSDYHWSISAVDLLNARAGALNATDVRDATALDPYVFTRDAYFQRRKFLIYDGDLPLDDMFSEFEDEFGEEFDDE